METHGAANLKASTTFIPQTLTNFGAQPVKCTNEKGTQQLSSYPPNDWHDPDFLFPVKYGTIGWFVLLLLLFAGQK